MPQIDNLTPQATYSLAIRLSPPSTPAKEVSISKPMFESSPKSLLSAFFDGSGVTAGSINMYSLPPLPTPKHSFNQVNVQLANMLGDIGLDIDAAQQGALDKAMALKDELLSILSSNGIHVSNVAGSAMFHKGKHLGSGKHGSVSVSPYDDNAVIKNISLGKAAKYVDIKASAGHSPAAEKIASEIILLQKFASSAIDGTTGLKGCAIDLTDGDDPKITFVMKKAEGATLEDHKMLGRGQAKDRKCIEITKNLLATLKQCHAQDICHTDVKPDNIFVDQNAKTTLVDWGEAVCPGIREKGKSDSFEAANDTYGPKPNELSDLFQTDVYSLASVVMGLYNKPPLNQFDNSAAIPLDGMPNNLAEFVKKAKEGTTAALALTMIN